MHDQITFGRRMQLWDPAGARPERRLPHVPRHLDRLPTEVRQPVWLSDHHSPGADWAPPQWDALECVTALIHVATAYPRSRYGQIVLGNSYRPPSLLGKQFATLQALTGVRCVLGIGAGWMASEYRMYGYEYPPPKVRIGQLADAVQVIRKLWRESPASFEGGYFRLEGAYAEPRPAEPPIIMIGGSGEQLTLRVVARHADWWNAGGGTPEQVAAKRAVLVEHCRKVGRDPDEILVNWQCQCLAVGDSQAEAQRIAGAAPLHAHERSAIVGTPEQVRERLQGFVDVGVRDFILRFADFPRLEGARRFAAEVAPKLRVGG